MSSSASSPSYQSQKTSTAGIDLPQGSSPVELGGRSSNKKARVFFIRLVSLNSMSHSVTPKIDSHISTIKPHALMFMICIAQEKCSRYCFPTLITFSLCYNNNISRLYGSDHKRFQFKYCNDLFFCQICIFVLI